MLIVMFNYWYETFIFYLWYKNYNKQINKDNTTTNDYIT